jgi:hypothetical protein
MPRFRGYCLTADDRIVWTLSVDAADVDAALDAAIEAARRAAHEHGVRLFTIVWSRQDHR